MGILLAFLLFSSTYKVVCANKLSSVQNIHQQYSESRPIMLTKLFITLFLAVSVRSLIIPNSEASNFLSRQRRANGPFEEALPSSIKRECQKEQCDFEEYVEAKENETKKNGIKLREVVKNNSQMKAEFEQIYTYCYKQVKTDEELADKNVFNFLPKCLEVLDEQFKEKGYFIDQTQTTPHPDY